MDEELMNDMELGYSNGLRAARNIISAKKEPLLQVILQTGQVAELDGKKLELLNEIENELLEKEAEM